MIEHILNVFAIRLFYNCPFIYVALYPMKMPSTTGQSLWWTCSLATQKPSKRPHITVCVPRGTHFTSAECSHIPDLVPMFHCAVQGSTTSQ